MLSARVLLIICLLFSIVSCSTKNSKSVPKKVTSPTTTPPDQTSQPPSEPQQTLAPPIPKTYDKNLDTYTSVLISEIKKQVSQDPLSKNMKIQNVEFANRIFKIKYQNTSQPKLTIYTHSDKVYNFQLTGREKNIQYFTAYENAEGLFNTDKSSVYSAEATTLKANNNKIVTVIKVKDLETHAVINVVYVKKAGRVIPALAEGYNYSRDLTKNSKVFIDRTRENPSVIGEFYNVITEERNTSNASRFKLTISNIFTMESQPLVDNYNETESKLLPLSIDYLNFGKSFFFGSAAYTVIRDSSYVMDSDRNPVELNYMNIALKVEAKEVIKGQKNTLPLKFYVQFL